MVEFRSRLEDIMLAIEISFPPSPGFGSYKTIMPEDSKRHPAKFNAHLVEFLISRYTEPGDLVLDPMAGTGILCVIAALRGRDAICIDIEPRFYTWIEMARENVEKTPTLGRKGKIISILGDARKLPEVLRQVDIIITSPPYAETYLGGGDPEKRAERLIKAGHDPKKFLGGRARNAVLKHYSEIDVIITSPPYESALEGTSRHTRGGIASRDPRLAQTGTYSYIVDAVITSPPYADMKKGGAADAMEMAERWDRIAKERNWNTWGRTWKTPGRLIALEALGSGYSDSRDNIGNLELGNIDAIITSPPYEEIMSERRHHTPNTGRAEKILDEKRLGIYYPSRADNIGNLKSSDDDYKMLENSGEDLDSLYKKLTKNGRTYLSEMLLVYDGMYKVLKKGGYAIVVIKPFQRRFKIVDLPHYTWLLMERVGFRLEKLYKFRLPTQSFWRILMAKKHPELPRIAHEYIIVARK